MDGTARTRGGLRLREGLTLTGRTGTNSSGRTAANDAAAVGGAVGAVGGAVGAVGALPGRLRDMLVVLPLCVFKPNPSLASLQ